MARLSPKGDKSLSGNWMHGAPPTRRRAAIGRAEGKVMRGAVGFAGYGGSRSWRLAVLEESTSAVARS